MGLTTKKTIESVKDEVREISNGEYEVISETYINNVSNLEFRHFLPDGSFHDYNSSRKAFITRGNRCPICNKNRLKNSNPNFKSLQQIKKELFSLVGDEYEIISEEYNNNKEKITFRHFLEDGTFHDFPMRYNDITNGHRCSICSGRKRKTQEEFENEVKELGKGQYIVKGNYKNSRTKVGLLHLKCDKIWKVRPDDFINGYQRCSYCSASNGEQIIMSYLERNNIDYEFQYTDRRCKNIRPLPFDFMININDKKILLEFDGIMHFEPIYGEKAFKDKIRNDQIKNNFCKKNNIPLLRIKYDKIKFIDVILDVFIENIC